MVRGGGRAENSFQVTSVQDTYASWPPRLYPTMRIDGLTRWPCSPLHVLPGLAAQTGATGLQAGLAAAAATAVTMTRRAPLCGPRRPC